MDWVTLIETNFECSGFRVAYRGKNSRNAIIIANLLSKFQFEDAEIQVYMLPSGFSNDEIIYALNHMREIWWQTSEEYPAKSQTTGELKRRS